MTLTPLALIAAAEAALVSGGYQSFDVTDVVAASPNSVARATFEDAFGVVAVHVFETTATLVAGWPDAQAALVEVMSRYLPAEEPKVWDGYLVLLTPDGAGLDDARSVRAIRYDTTRVRKLVAFGGELATTPDVHRALSSLLPLEAGDEGVQLAPLDLLPTILGARGIEAGLTDAVVRAYENQTPMIQVIADYFRGP